jgi:hypothetical protein
VTSKSPFPGYVEVDEMGKVVAQGNRYVEGWEQFIRDEFQSKQAIHTTSAGETPPTHYKMHRREQG